MTDSSSDDENIIKLQQSVDSQFFNNDLFMQQSNYNYIETKTSLPPSLRSVHSDEWQNGSLNVTPEFQTHVAKHLSALLDQQVKEVALAIPKRKRSKAQGVRLLSSCNHCLESKDAEDMSAAHNAKRKARLNGGEVNQEEETKKVKEVAVDAEWLLNGEATRGWEKSTRGEVITGAKHLSIETKKKKRKKKSIGKEIEKAK